MKLFGKFLKSAKEEVLQLPDEELLKIMTESRTSREIEGDDWWTDDGKFMEDEYKNHIYNEMKYCLADFREFIKSSGFGTNEIKLARCVNLNDKLNKEHLGICWTTPEYFDYYARYNLPKNNLYCMLGVTSSDNINWDDSLFVFAQFWNNSDEYELRVVDDTKVQLLDIKKVVDWKLVDLTKEDYKRIME